MFDLSQQLQVSMDAAQDEVDAEKQKVKTAKSDMEKLVTELTELKVQSATDREERDKLQGLVLVGDWQAGKRTGMLAIFIPPIAVLSLSINHHIVLKLVIQEHLSF